MAYLHQRLNIDSIKETIKDGSSANLVGKQSEEMIFYKNNIAKYRHSFSLWRNYLNVHFNSVSQNSNIRCTNACISDVKKLAGRTAPDNNQNLINTCFENCAYHYLNRPNVNMKV